MNSNDKTSKTSKTSKNQNTPPAKPSDLPPEAQKRVDALNRRVELKKERLALIKKQIIQLDEKTDAMFIPRVN